MPTPDGKARRGEMDDERFEENVAAKQARMRRYRKVGDRGIWFGLGVFGAVGWSIAIPVVLGALVGVWLDSRTTGGIRWTLSLMTLGLIVGAVNAWNWIEKSRSEGIEEELRGAGPLDELEIGEPGESGEFGERSGSVALGEAGAFGEPGEFGKHSGSGENGGTGELGKPRETSKLGASGTSHGSGGSENRSGEAEIQEQQGNRGRGEDVRA